MSNNTANSSRWNAVAEVDTLLADALHTMSFEERELLYEEIHGVSSTILETDELMATSLHAMEKELVKITHKPAYDLALATASLTTSREYVTSRTFQIMFLRAQRFDPSKAARHLVRFLNEKLDLFGPDTLGRRLYLSDLNKDDLHCLEMGIVQLLPKRDRAGRAILLCNLAGVAPENRYKTTENFLRVFFYVATAMVEDDEETQKKGIVGIGRPMTFDLNVMSKGPKVIQAFPCRVVALHGFIENQNNPTVRSFMNLVASSFGRHFHGRIKIHYGSPTECQYSIITYGVPTDVFPVTYDGELKLIHHIKWIAKRKIRDKQLQSQGYFYGIDIPGENDVLAGRGNTFRDHTGNVKMRHLVRLQIGECHKSDLSKAERDQVLTHVHEEIKKYGGRFLKRDKDGWWWEENFDEAHNRLTLAVRTFFSSGPQLEIYSRRAILTTKFLEEQDRNIKKRRRTYDNNENDHHHHDHHQHENTCFGFPFG